MANFINLIDLDLTYCKRILKKCTRSGSQLYRTRLVRPFNSCWAAVVLATVWIASRLEMQQITVPIRVPIVLVIPSEFPDILFPLPFTAQLMFAGEMAHERLKAKINWLSTFSVSLATKNVQIAPLPIRNGQASTWESRCASVWNVHKIFWNSVLIDRWTAACSGIHRSLGVHVSKVRSLRWDKWDSETVQVMICLGNALVNSIYEAKTQETVGPNRPHSQSPQAERDLWIQAKYVKKLFVDYQWNGMDENGVDLLVNMQPRSGYSKRNDGQLDLFL